MSVAATVDILEGYWGANGPASQSVVDAGSATKD